MRCYSLKSKTGEDQSEKTCKTLDKPDDRLKCLRWEKFECFYCCSEWPCSGARFLASEIGDGVRSKNDTRRDKERAISLSVVGVRTPRGEDSLFLSKSGGNLKESAKMLPLEQRACGIA